MNQLSEIVIWGTSGHAKVVAELVEIGTHFKIAAFVNDTEAVSDSLFGIRVLRDRDELLRLRDAGVRRIIIGFGDCAQRLSVAKWCCAKEFELISAIHPSSIISQHSTIGSGTVIMAGAIINAGATVGDNVIINTAASVDHDCVIEDGVHLSPGVRLGGHVRVHRGAWIGIGSSVRDHTTIGPFAVVGAGSLVITDIPGSVIAYGSPARIVRKGL